MKTLSEISNFDANVQAPEDGVDDKSATTVETGLQQLTNRTRQLKDRLDDELPKRINGDVGGDWAPSSTIMLGGEGLTLYGAVPFMPVIGADKATPVSFTFRQPLIPIFANSTTQDHWTFDVLNGIWTQADVSLNVEPCFPLLNLPKFGIITDLTITVDGSGASHGALPASLPGFRLKRKGTASEWFTELSVVDPSGDLAAYEQVHSFGGSGLSIGTTGATDFDRNLYLQVKGETLANALNNAFSLIDISVVCQVIRHGL